MPRLIDLAGRKFGRLLVKERDFSSKRTKWICECKCGKIKSIQSTHLLSGATTSCGCYQKEKAKESNEIHGLTRTSLHNRWKALKQRCLNPKSSRYDDYGNRGITLCEEWLDFENFHEWAIKNGYKEGLSLDRIDNDKGYYPTNCRWTTEITQNRNKRNVVWVNNGDSKIRLREVSEFTKVNYNTLYARYEKLGKKNLDIKDILNKEEYKLIPSQDN